MTPVRLVGPFVIEVDVPITRRLKLHAVVDGNNNQIFHSRRISEVFQFILDRELGEVVLVDEDYEFRIDIKPPLPPLKL